MRKFNFREFRFPACLFGVLLFLTCCQGIPDPPAPAEPAHYVSEDGAAKLTVTQDRFDLQAAFVAGGTRITRDWDGQTHLAGIVDSFHFDPAYSAHVCVLHVTYIAQVMPGGLERVQGVDFLTNGPWTGGRAILPITDSTAGPANGWYFRREYANPIPPAPPQ